MSIYACSLFKSQPTRRSLISKVAKRAARFEVDLRLLEELEKRICLSTISFMDSGTGGSVLTFDAAPDIQNQVTLSFADGVYTITDPNDKITDAVDVPRGCKVQGISGGRQNRPVTVDCKGDIIAKVAFNTGNLDDVVLIESTIDDIEVDGGGDLGDRLILDDSTNTAATGITISPGLVSDWTAPGGPGVTYADISGLYVLLGSGSDLVQVGTATDSLADLDAKLFISAGGGTNHLVVQDDGGTLSANSYLVSETDAATSDFEYQVQLNTATVVEYEDVEEVTLKTGASEDAIEVTVSGAAFPSLVHVKSGAGNDTISVKLSAPTLSTTIDVDGQDGTDSLAVNSGDSPDVIVVNDDGDIVVGETVTTVIQLSNIENSTLFGGDGNDDIDVSSATFAVTIYGGEGDDSIKGGSGDDIIFGGTGADGEESTGDDVIFGGGGNDTINTGDGNDVIFGGGGNDTINTGDGNDVIFGGGGNDTINTGDGNDVIFGGGGNDTINTGDGNDVIFGGDGEGDVDGTGDDIIFGGSGNDTINTGDGNDVIFGGSGNDSINTGDGNDVIFGGGGNDTINTGDGNDVIFGGGGNDTINTGDGNDVIFGGGGNDTINTGDGNDVIFGGECQAFDTDGVTCVSADSDDTGDDIIFGGGGNDTINTGDGNDVIFGGAGLDEIDAGAGDDIIFADEGDDVMAGGDGDDYYLFQGTNLGADTIIEAPNADTDTLDFSTLAGPIEIDLASFATQSVSTEIGSLTFSHPTGGPLDEFTGLENVIATAGADRIYGNSRDNVLLGADILELTPVPKPLQSNFVQWVLLDFDSDSDDGEHVYTATERDEIQSRLEIDFGTHFSFVFTQEDPSSVPGVEEFATIFFNKQGSLGEAGQADELDFRNVNLGGTAAVDINVILGGADQPELSSENVIGASASVAAHELAHLIGLRHTDSFGPIGFGVHAPPGVDAFRPAYPGLSAAFETTDHLMASPNSVGSSLEDAVGDPFFSERSAIKLAFAEYGVPVEEALGDHSTPETAQFVPLEGLYVPNTLLSGINSQKQLAADAAVVLGTIELDASETSQSDFYAFYGTAGDVFTFEVHSASLDRIADPIDPVLRVTNVVGEELPFFGGTATNDDSFEPPDSVLMDFVLPTDGIFHVEVEPFAFSDLAAEDFEFYCTGDGEFVGTEACADQDTGDYELLVYRFDAGHVTDEADIIMGREGNDTLQGGLGGDTIDGQAGIDLLVEVRDSNMTLGDTSLSIGGESSDSLASIERARIVGGPGDNTLHAGGFSGQVTILGLGGDDNLKGGSGDDRLEGGEGNDQIGGSAGNDILLGGAGDDHLGGNSGRDLLIGDDGIDRLVGGPDDDILLGGSVLEPILPVALDQVMAMWISNAAYADRVAAVRAVLNSLTVTDDDDIDTLTGSSEQDYFLLFASVDITDQKPDEEFD